MKIFTKTQSCWFCALKTGCTQESNEKKTRNKSLKTDISEFLVELQICTNKHVVKPTELAAKICRRNERHFAENKTDCDGPSWKTIRHKPSSVICVLSDVCIKSGWSFLIHDLLRFCQSFHPFVVPDLGFFANLGRQLCWFDDMFICNNL